LDVERTSVNSLQEQVVSWARIGAAVGHGDIATTARHYTHVADERELDYAGMLTDVASEPAIFERLPRRT